MAGDSYRPGPRVPPPPSLASRVTFTHGGGDNYDTYRPDRASGQNGVPRGEFTFSSGRQGPQFPPAGPADSRPSQRRRNGPSRSHGDHYAPDRAAGSQGSARNRRNHDRQNNGGNRERGGPRRQFRKAAPHERALLQNRDATSPERTLGVTEGVNKFLALDDLSASESDMDLDDTHGSGSESAGDNREPSHKMARVRSVSRDDGDSVPKWSNPDPYTVLPPPSETGKKKDFVQLIRKAKNQAVEKVQTSNAVTANDDFISFGDDDEAEDGEEEDGQKASASAVPPPPPESPPLPPPPPQTSVPHDRPALTGSLNDISKPGMPASASHAMKRSADAAGLPQRPQQAPSTKRKRDQFSGGIIERWLPLPHGVSAPWCRNRDYQAKIMQKDGSDYDKMLMLFHNEIMDFYDYVEPSARDETVRAGIISKIERIIGPPRAVLDDACSIKCFGSFPAKLYLPTADMDLVLVSDSYLKGGRSMLDTSHQPSVRRALRAAANKLQRAGMFAEQPTLIFRAKVPIVKFVDRQSRIQVDLSFENLSGVVAQETFRKWTSEIPNMFPLIALIKQFLVMRDLNDVHTGGLGGFSIICLVYTYLRNHLPDPAEGEMVNLAKLFMGFLDFWGNKFDLATQRLETTSDPPRIVQKDEYGIDGRKEKVDGLSIQDPNNPSNNVSGGSHRARHVLRLFSEAHKSLRQRLETLDLSGISILDTIIGGNYESYDRHWNRLRQIV